MSAFLHALSCIARGWHVFPCNGKIPILDGGYKTASLDDAKVREWWTQHPHANVGIATGASGLTVLDIDTGLLDEESLRAFMAAHDLPPTFAVRTGKRPEYRVQLYYSEPIESFNHWEWNGYGGDVRGTWGHVLAAGSIHPESGAAYEVLWDVPIRPVPNFVRALKAKTKEREALSDPSSPVTEWRNDTLFRVLGKLRGAGADDELIREFAVRTNAKRIKPPLEEEELEDIIEKVCRYAQGVPEPIVTIGGKTLEPTAPVEPVDWRTRYVTLEKVRDAKQTSFFIEGFLALDSITALAAPVGQRKSLIALNVAHSLCTGESLFGYFKVAKQPERVIYLCPEMGLSSFSTRIKSIGLLGYVGKTLFCQTMDDISVSLGELNEELPGAVVIIDTLTRFVEGDQNSSADMAKFAQEIFRLKRCGATVLLLHHSVKGTGNAITLDSAMRGSTELAAFVTSCWATKLKDPDDPYNSPSLLVNVKQRDYESKPFEAISDKSCRMRILGTPGEMAEIKSRADADAEKALAAILEESPNLGVNKLQAALRDAGYKKGVKWVTKVRSGVRGRGVVLSSA
jgi:hypothetical protein